MLRTIVMSPLLLMTALGEEGQTQTVASRLVGKFNPIGHWDKNPKCIATTERVFARDTDRQRRSVAC
jgi:hypothetical protein